MKKRRSLSLKNKLRASASLPHFHALKLFPLKPGSRIPGDWFKGKIPSNIQAAETSRIDSSAAFKGFRSRVAAGLQVGPHTMIFGTRFSVGEQGSLKIGAYCYLGEADLLCEESIMLGNRVVVGTNACIADADFHPLDPVLRARDCLALAPGMKRKRPPFKKRPVIIEDDVWIGFGAVILKGVRVGRGAVIEAGSVVTRDVPAWALATGNPAVLSKKNAAGKNHG